MIRPEVYFIEDGNKIKINGIYKMNDDLLEIMFNFNNEGHLKLVEKAFRKEIVYIQIVLGDKNIYLYGLAEFEDNNYFCDETYYGSMHIELSPNKKHFIY